jgi:hypothetical protein
METVERASIDLTNPSLIENVDYAFFDWADIKLNLSCTTKDGFKKIPVIWVSPERAYQIKENKEFRDLDGSLIPPLMTIERVSINKEQNNRGAFFNNLPPNKNRVNISRKINQSKTGAFANADSLRKYRQVNFKTSKENQKVVYETKTYFLPVYVSFEYSITLMTQYQQQMNELLQPFLTKTGSTRYFIIEKDGGKYECYIDGSIEQNNSTSNLETEERRYISKIKIKVLANLSTDGVNENNSPVKISENAVEIKLPKENITLSFEEGMRQKPFAKAPNAAIGISSGVALKKTFLIGNGVDSVYSVTHGLSTRDMYMSIRENFGDYAIVQVAVSFVDTNSISIDMGDIIPNNSYVVTIIG